MPFPKSFPTPKKIHLTLPPNHFLISEPRWTTYCLSISITEVCHLSRRKDRGLIWKAKRSGLMAEIYIQLHVRDCVAKGNYTPVLSFRMPFTLGGNYRIFFQCSK